MTANFHFFGIGLTLESGNPGLRGRRSPWKPAFAGATITVVKVDYISAMLRNLENIDRREREEAATPARRVSPCTPWRHVVTDTAVRAAPRAWLFREADSRLWLVGVVVFAVRWVEMLAVAVSPISVPARR